MTDWVSVTDSQLDPDAPITSGLGYAWRDNPIALAEGAPGAPRIYGNAMHGPAAGTLAQRNCLNFGSETVTSNTATQVISRIHASSFTALVACTVRVRVTINVSGTAGTLVIFKNGSANTTFSTDQTNTDTDITLAQGDYLACWITATGTGGGSTGTCDLTKLEYRFDARSSIMT